MLIVVTKGVRKNLDVVLAALALLWHSSSRSQEDGLFVCPHRISPFCYVCLQRVYMFKLVNASYVSLLVVVTKCIVKEFDVVKLQWQL